MPVQRTLRGPICAPYEKHREIEWERRERALSKKQNDGDPDLHAAHKQYVHAFFDLLRTRIFVRDGFDEHGAHITGSFFVHEVVTSPMQAEALFFLRISPSGEQEGSFLVSVGLSTYIMYHHFA